VIGSARTCALVDFPNHPNVGDSAIWLGEKAALQRLGCAVSYACDLVSYSETDLASSLAGGIILLHGGGNFGDLWPEHQRFRERIVAGFPRNKIIQLPQTIHFQSKKSLERAREVLNGHPDFTIMARDRRSLEFARQEFRAGSLLCPDMAFALGSFDRPCDPSEEVICLLRTDIESGNSRSAAASGLQRFDWLEDDRSVLMAMNSFLHRRLHRCPANLARIASRFLYSRAVCDRVASARLIRGLKLLGRGKVVITDRLHGHILSLMSGIPHVIVDNSYGKLGSFWQTWTSDGPAAAWADSLAEALESAHRILRSDHL
jgi:pyruvyl transferase EpsO